MLRNAPTSQRHPSGKIAKGHLFVKQMSFVAIAWGFRARERKLGCSSWPDRGRFWPAVSAVHRGFSTVWYGAVSRVGRVTERKIRGRAEQDFRQRTGDGLRILHTGYLEGAATWARRPIRRGRAKVTRRTSR